MNTPGANAIAVAELTIGLMIALARQLPRANAALHAGKWEKKSLEGRELRGKTLGILGLGRMSDRKSPAAPATSAWNWHCLRPVRFAGARPRERSPPGRARRTLARLRLLSRCTSA
jgi:hypothetical protein